MRPETSREHPPVAVSQPPAEAAFHALLRAFGLLRHVMEPYFAKYGISGSQWAILRVLHRAAASEGTGLRLRDLSERLLLQPPSVTGVVDRLERQGLVKRGGSKSDLRVRQVSLTRAGRELVTTVLKGHSRQIARLFGGHSRAELESFRRLLDKLGAHLDSLGRHAPAAERARPGAAEI
jgi:DNA-binding MarR family transcriptional regulator